MSEQVTCHEWVEPQEYPDDAKTPCWQCINKSATDYIVVFEGYCPTCGDRLNADGTVTPRVDEADLRAIVQRYVYYLTECDSCLLDKKDACPVWSQVVPDDITEDHCLQALLAHFGLESQ